MEAQLSGRKQVSVVHHLFVPPAGHRAGFHSQSRPQSFRSPHCGANIISSDLTAAILTVMFYTFERGVRTAPSQYPRIPFHVIRVFQLIASLVVGAIMCYFIWHLTHDHWATPWTFIWACAGPPWLFARLLLIILQLTSASLFSIAALAFTIILYCLTGLNSGLNLYINGFLTLLWTLSWSLLTWFISGTLANMCDIDHWNEEIGIMVCRIYKALFSFTLVGLYVLQYLSRLHTWF